MKCVQPRGMDKRASCGSSTDLKVRNPTSVSLPRRGMPMNGSFAPEGVVHVPTMI
jgi:hypothetical protein